LIANKTYIQDADGVNSENSLLEYSNGRTAKKDVRYINEHIGVNRMTFSVFFLVGVLQ
jgi:hypothetical protein